MYDTVGFLPGMNGHYFVGISTKVYQCHDSLEIKIGRRKKERCVNQCPPHRKNPSSHSLLLLMSTETPFYPMDPGTSINSADEGATTQAYEYLSTLLYVL